MTSDESDTLRGTDDDGEDPPRDPDTGKFLPKDERQRDDTESGVAEGDEMVSDDTESAASMDEIETERTGSSTPPGRPSNEMPRDGDPPGVPGSRVSLSGPVAASATAAGSSVFVHDPRGYPRSHAAYLPALPWLRVPVKPPSYPTVVVPYSSE